MSAFDKVVARARARCLAKGLTPAPVMFCPACGARLHDVNEQGLGRCPLCKEVMEGEPGDE